MIGNVVCAGTIGFENVVVLVIIEDILVDIGTVPGISSSGLGGIEKGGLLKMKVSTRRRRIWRRSLLEKER